MSQTTENLPTMANPETSLYAAYNSGSTKELIEAVNSAFNSGFVTEALSKPNTIITAIVRSAAIVAANYALSGKVVKFRHDGYDMASMWITTLFNCQTVSHKALSAFIKELGFSLKVESGQETTKNVGGKVYKRTVFSVTLSHNPNKNLLINQKTVDSNHDFDYENWLEFIDSLEYQDFLDLKNSKEAKAFEVDFSAWKKHALNNATISYILGLTDREELLQEFTEHDVNRIIATLSKDKKLIDQAGKKLLDVIQVEQTE